MPSSHSDRFRERESTLEMKERRKHRSSRTKRKSRSKEEIRDESPVSERKSFQADESPQRKNSIPIPELGRRASSASPNGSRSSLAYPSFSKEHSREAVGSKESLNTPPRNNIFTPDPTDLHDKSANKQDQSNRTSMYSQAVNINGPPSPPLTAAESAAAIEEKRRKLETQGEDMRTKLKETRAASGSQIPARSSPLSMTRKADNANGVRSANSGTPTKSRPQVTSMDEFFAPVSNRSETKSPSSRSTPATEIDTGPPSAVNSATSSKTPTQQKPQAPFTPDADDESSPTTGSDSSVKTPTPRGTPFPSGGKQVPTYAVPLAAAPNANGESPMPPPPPPPPAPLHPPRVDYLMQNGGLPHRIPKSFITAAEPDHSAPFVVGELPNPTAMSGHVRRVFAPFIKVLDDYNKVMARSGSVAVATGYKSIARRLLDRLENVFARDISSEVCACVMCDTPDNQTLDDERGMSWGEILEFVCGRQELPQWPPFVLDHEPVGLGISGDELKTPMQELDMDVPDQYREHYIRQSKKTKQSVDRWLAGQNNDENAPDDADDDTLTFAILTHLEPERRPIFGQLLGVAPSRPASVSPEVRAKTPLNAPKSELIIRTSLALQRLYRLINPPRAPECAIYLLNNPHLHNVLATLAAISDGEWEILISGRFDGFLRSGAEEHNGNAAPQAPQRSVSNSGGRTSRGPTPLTAPSPAPPSAASLGAPVAMDEETEIAVLAEIEREIYLGMEALEDAFEAVHTSAEATRRALRERGAGLSMASQARRGGAAGVVEARLGTPASARGWDSEDGTDDGIDDALSELAPDDSASNYSRSRVRRPKRRVERRTPSVVAEESDDGGVGGKRDVKEMKEVREKAGSRTAGLWSRGSFKKR